MNHSSPLHLLHRVHGIGLVDDVFGHTYYFRLARLYLRLSSHYWYRMETCNQEPWVKSKPIFLSLLI